MGKGGNGRYASPGRVDWKGKASGKSGGKSKNSGARSRTQTPVGGSASRGPLGGAEVGINRAIVSRACAWVPNANNSVPVPKQQPAYNAAAASASSSGDVRDEYPSVLRSSDGSTYVDPDLAEVIGLQNYVDYDDETGLAVGIS